MRVQRVLKSAKSDYWTHLDGRAMGGLGRLGVAGGWPKGSRDLVSATLGVGDHSQGASGGEIVQYSEGRKWVRGAKI